MPKLVWVDAKSVNDPGPQNKVKGQTSAKLQKSVKMKIDIIVLENNGLIIGNLYSCHSLTCLQRHRGGCQDCKCSWVTELGQKSNECKITNTHYNNQVFLKSNMN